MHIVARIAFLSLNLALMSLALAGCEGMAGVNSNAAAAADTAPYPYRGLAPAAPPELKPEAVPVIDDPRADLWRPGYWTYHDGAFDWIPGAVIARPSPTAVWRNAFWLRHDYGWAFVPGHWM